MVAQVPVTTAHLVIQISHLFLKSTALHHFKVLQINLEKNQNIAYIQLNTCVQSTETK